MAMSYIHHHIIVAEKLIKDYTYNTPFSVYLKDYFSKNKKHGSKDRKWIAHLCYCYYRLGHALKELNIEERLRIAFYLCNDEAGEWQILFNTSWNEWSNELNKRIEFVQKKYPMFSLNDIFPWKDHFSETIDTTAFAVSHLIQPDLFLRIRPNKESIVKEKLSANNILYQQLSSTCLAVSNSSKIDSIIELDKEAVVQDYSSQRISEFLQLTTNNSKLTTCLWDCCAASGGKSILSKDILGEIELTVTDVRSSILQNLKQRFANAGIKSYYSFVADLSNSKFEIRNSKFNIILCDAPCSGSGTWSRTPEQLYFFSNEKINVFSVLYKPRCEYITLKF